LAHQVILYLAAAGIGHITILDDDKVTLTDLNRQIIYTMQNIGASKASQAASAATKLNPVIVAEHLDARLSPDNAATLIEAHDIIVDCSDNPETRQLVGTSCHHLKRPLVFGGACAARRSGGGVSKRYRWLYRHAMLLLRVSGNAQCTTSPPLFTGWHSGAYHWRHWCDAGARNHQAMSWAWH
jgi:hypothetical protein